MIQIYNENCMETMDKMDAGTIDAIITSPPYNNGRSLDSNSSGSFYDEYDDKLSEEEYREFTLNLFTKFDRIIKPNGIVLYNINYNSHNTALPYLVMADILEKTNWTVSDTIIWKKPSALPNNVDPRHLTRIWEFVWVFCRKTETATHITNRQISRISPVGQKFYKSIFNLLDAPNNDCPTPDINQATYSSELVTQLLKIYVKNEPSVTIYDPFMGTGTTAVACKRYGVNCIGSELSAKQCDYAKNRLDATNKVKSILDWS